MFHISKNRFGFTLIELMIVITIISILSIGTYLPYNYYSRVSKLRISTEKVHQTMEYAKILSQNGQVFPGTIKNADIGILFEKESNIISIFAFIPGNHSMIENENAKILKKIGLEDSININTFLPDSDKMLVIYNAPKGNKEIYKNSIDTVTDFEIGIGWKNAINGTLYKTLKIEK